MYIKVSDFQSFILNLWKDEEEIARIMKSTKDGDNELFVEGFKFGLIWGGLCSATSQIPCYFECGEINDINCETRRRTEDSSSEI